MNRGKLFLCIFFVIIVAYYFVHHRCEYIDGKVVNIVCLDLKKNIDGCIGVRDFVWCLRKTGTVVLENSKYIGYLNVFFPNKIGPKIYRIEYDSVNEKYSSVPIEIDYIKGINEEGTSVGSVIKVGDDKYRLYYAGLTKENGKARYRTFNVADSHDGKTFKTREKALLMDAEYKENEHIGLPYTCFDTSTGIYYMTFEGILHNAYHIWGAFSKDGVSWEKLNGGKPVISPRDISWGDGGCANPKLHPLGNGDFILGFNAYPKENKSSWKIGTLLLHIDNNGETVIKSISKPMIDERIVDGYRIESAIFNSPKGFFKEITFFCTPTADATKGADVYKGIIN